MDEALGAAIEAIRNWADGHHEIARVIIFGSRARGISRNGEPPRSDSDLDIAIELTIERSELEKHDRKLRIEWAAQLAKLIEFKPDVHEMDSTTPALNSYVRNDALIVFERSGAIMPNNGQN
jgi:predicted nucleotidyltransferase